LSGNLDLVALATAGLYDADAPDAIERRELLHFLIEQGCTVDEMVSANARGRLFALAGDRIVRPARDQHTLRDVADQPVASDADVDMIRTAVGMSGVLGVEATLGLARVMGSSMARVGDAASTSVRGNMPSMSVAVSGSELETARAFAGIAGAVPALGRVLDTLFRHHLESARMHFERTESWDIVGQGGIRVGVGFTDLCGFTGLTQQLSMDNLSLLLTRFEEIATDVVNDHGARLVKFIGDAVMFVATDALTAVQVAEALVTSAQVRGLMARGGVTVGAALALDGDYFGPVVNLASRLCNLADPGTVLVSDEVAERVRDTRSAVSLGPQQIRGFDEPINVFRLATVG
jgi:class 3 adenylate cyclase